MLFRQSPRNHADTAVRQAAAEAALALARAETPVIAAQTARLVRAEGLNGFTELLDTAFRRGQNGHAR